MKNMNLNLCGMWLIYENPDLNLLQTGAGASYSGIPPLCNCVRVPVILFEPQVAIMSSCQATDYEHK